MSKGQVLETVVSIQGIMSDSVRKSVQDVRKQFGLVDKKTLETAKKMAALGAAAASAAGAMAAAFIKKGSDLNRTFNVIAVQTGATGKELEEFKDITRDIYESGKGESLQEIADALVNIRQASGLAGDELKEAANSAVLLKDSFGMETEETTRAATALMKNFGIGAKEAYGIIAYGAQNGANKNGDLLDTLNEYSVHYKALGLDAEQFVDSLVKGAESGAFSIDKVGDAIKEFTIRSKDGSKTSAEGFEALGLNAETMTAQFAQGGRVAEAAFFQTVKALDSMKDPVAKNAAGVALFGTQFEDLEAGALKAFTNMSGSAIDAEKTLADIEKIKYNDLGYAISQVGRTFETALMPSAEKAGQIIFDQMPAIKENIAKVTPYVTQLAEAFTAALPGIIDGLAGAAQNAAEFAQMVTDNWGTIEPVLLGVAAAYGAFKFAQFTRNAWLATAAVVANTQAAWASTAALRGQLAAGIKASALAVKDAVVWTGKTAALVAGTVAQIAATAATVAWSAAAFIAQGATMALGAAVAFLTSPIGIAVLAIAGLIAAGVWLYKNWDTVKEKASELGAWMGAKWTEMKDAVVGIVTDLGNSIAAGWESIKTAASNAATALGDAVLSAWTWYKEQWIGVFTGLRDGLSGIWSAIKTTVSGYASGLADLVGQAWQRIKDGASNLGTSIIGSLKNAFSSIPDILKAPINGAIRVINGAISGINGIGFTIPDWVPGIGGKAFSVDVPTIPMLAKGGFTTGPSIAGEAGTEAVISFDPAYREQNIGYLAKAASMLGLRASDEGTVGYYAQRLESLGAGESLASTTNNSTTINLGGVTFAPTVTVAGSDEKKQNIIEQLRNYQGDLLELIEDLLATKEAASYGASNAF